MSEHVIEIDASPEEVWEVWTDVVAWPRWNSSVRSLTRLDPGKFGRGSKARLQQPQLPPAVWRVTEWEPYATWVWVASQTGLSTTATHRIEDLGDGRCRVTASAQHTGLLARLVGAVTGGVTRTLVSRELADLKTQCESGTSVPRQHPPEGLRH
ncbi:MAG: SRPBCC family protein [Lapillicoccus sp.]